PGSIVAGGLMPEGLHARIIVDEQTEYWIEPISDRIPGAEAGMHVVYTSENLVRGDWRCGNTDMPVRRPNLAGEDAGDGPRPRGATLYTAQLACDADWPYFQRYGGSSNVQSRIAIITNTMNVQYERDVDIQHVI